MFLRTPSRPSPALFSPPPHSPPPQSERRPRRPIGLVQQELLLSIGGVPANGKVDALVAMFDAAAAAAQPTGRPG